MSRYGAKDVKLEANGIEAGKAPGLAGGVERIGRRADAEMADIATCSFQASKPSACTPTATSR